MIGDDAIMDEEYLSAFVEVGVCVVVNLFAAGSPTRMGNSTSGNAGLTHHLLHHLVNAPCLFHPLLRVLHQTTPVNHIPSQRVHSRTVVSTILQQLDSLAEKLLQTVAIVFLGHLRLFLLRNGCFHDHSDDSTAFRFLLTHQRVAQR